MTTKQINSLSEVSLADITFEDIRWHYGTGIRISDGVGRNKTYRSRNGVMTKLGDIEERLWYELAESLIKRAGEEPLLNSLIEWRSDHNYAKNTPSQVRRDALHHHANRIFDDPRWVGFVRFNRKYRPERLENVNLITVINECCGMPGEITQEQLTAVYNDTVACPHCGRWSGFVVQAADSDT